MPQVFCQIGGIRALDVESRESKYTNRHSATDFEKAINVLTKQAYLSIQSTSRVFLPAFFMIVPIFLIGISRNHLDVNARTLARGQASVFVEDLKTKNNP